MKNDLLNGFFLKQIIFLIKREANNNLVFLKSSHLHGSQMKSRQSSDRIVMIAQQILKDSVSQSGLKKLNDIKKSLDVRSSKTRKKSHEKSKEKIRQLSNSRRVPQSPQAYSEVRKRSVSRPQDTYTKSYSRLSSVDNSESRTKKRSVRFSLQHQYPQTSNPHKRSPLKQQSNNQSQKTILKQSSFKKPASPRRNGQSQLPTAKVMTKNDSMSLIKKPTLQNFSTQHIVAKKLFGDDLKSKPVIQNEISFNLNLNKLLKIVQQVTQTQKIQKENISSSSSKKESLLSQENMKLIKKIGRQLGNSKENVDLEEGYRRKGLERETPAKASGKENYDRAREYRIDYISEETQGQERDQKQHKALQMRKEDKQNVKRTPSRPSPEPHTQEEQQFSVTTQKYQSTHSLNPNNINPPNRPIKSSQSKFVQKQAIQEMNQKISGLKKDKEWLIGTVETLLEENQQLKKLLVGSSIN